MKKLRRNYNRFVNRNRDKGIPRLMLWICVANAVVFLVDYVSQTNLLYSWLGFDAALILKGQIWRLFSYIFTFAMESSFLSSKLLGAIISIMFYYWIGNLLESIWGRLRFNLFYFSGILLMDLAGLAMYLTFGLGGQVSSYCINLSMFLAVATLIPEQRVYLYMILPVKMKWLAWLDLGLTALGIARGLYEAVIFWRIYGPVIGVAFTLYSLFPLIALLNYFLFFGRNIKNLFPRRKRANRRTDYRWENNAEPDFRRAASQQSKAAEEKPYRHKCTVCGRTDVDCPGLEFRYCSKCKGYFCYCIDHINNHTHVE